MLRMLIIQELPATQTSIFGQIFCIVCDNYLDTAFDFDARDEMNELARQKYFIIYTKTG